MLQCHESSANIESTIDTLDRHGFCSVEDHSVCPFGAVAEVDE